MPGIDLNTIFISIPIILTECLQVMSYHNSQFRDKAMATQEVFKKLSISFMW